MSNFWPQPRMLIICAPQLSADIQPDMIFTRRKKESNAFYKHLQIFHPEEEGGIENFDIQVQSVHKRSLTRQKTEAVKIQSSTADHLLNSKAEHRQPALLRVRMTRENNNDDLPRQGRGGDGAHQPARRRGGN